MGQAILWLVLITLIPTLELRASIPYGMIKTELGTTTVVVACLLANIAIAPAGLLTGPATITVPEGASIASETYTGASTEMMGTEMTETVPGTSNSGRLRFRPCTDM